MVGILLAMGALTGHPHFHAIALKLLKYLLMLGFKPRIAGLGSDHSSNCTETLEVSETRFRIQTVKAINVCLLL